MAGTDTITIYRGETVDLEFTMSPVENITGWTLLFTVEGPGTTKAIQVAGVVVSGIAGTFKAPLAAADSEELRPGEYQYDVWRTDSGSERVLATGTFVVSDVARLPPEA